MNVNTSTLGLKIDGQILGCNKSAKHVTTLTGIYDADADSECEELTYKNLAASFKELCLMSEEVCQKQKITIT